MDLEDCLIILIAVIVIYMIISIAFDWDSPTSAVCAGVGLLTATSLDSNKTDKIVGSSEGSEGGKELNKIPDRPDNLEVPKVDPFGEDHKISKIRHKQYDEYDDAELLKELDPTMMKSFDNIVVDGNNFIHRMRDDLYNSRKFVNAKEILDYIRNAIKLLVKHFPEKNIYFVSKDPENEHQEKDLIQEMEAKNVRDAHKKFFNPITKEYPKVRFVIAYGDAKYRDDYAAIWLADTLPDDTILLSRDRYRDVPDMASAKLKFITYGKRASAINKIINKPFNFITKGAVKAGLVGYSFSKKRKSGFYDKDVNRKSLASDVVYIFKV